jgi:radical SAM protein with 4Fe4S-binding SPASM domain
MITPAIADRLAAERPLAIEITLYGASAGTYEALTGLPGSYPRCLRGIQLLHERRLPLRLKSVAVRTNKHELADMRRFAEGLNLPFKFDAMINPRLDCSQSPLEVRLDPSECVALDLADPRRMAEWDRFLEKQAARPASAGSDQLYQCGGGQNSFAVDPYGGMSICVLSEREKYDLRSGTVAGGWHQFLHRIRRKRVTRPTKCSRCQMKAMCGMCPANGELENGDPEAPVDFLCQVAHLRAHALGVSVAEHGACEYCPGGEGHAALMAAFDGATAAAPDRGSHPAGISKNRVPLLPADSDRPESDCGGGCGACGA